MSEPRYLVRIVTGYRTARIGGNPLPVHLSAMVLDRLWAWRLVAQYRSEDLHATDGNRASGDTRVRALARATEHAARLNAEPL